ncbi:large conductance mechanosensitive channel protein MscL [Anaeropeptidivorans aminofermentans]|jgi:large conductance mechanosensitive channel|uniref:large conductance mechanosensitive channel protein MscL n=1 Tax=Anaeropeptidivorans aminofermentans TaxID=2934315 RepID=UPI002024D079|nr:large conductance mechanosensitive channel protein MscL [Anaeropeptidivorans aminofermentans]MBE6012294.1 large conductance mechanosensitive channel protein MscL [Lachnospiraceae bacterium]
MKKIFQEFKEFINRGNVMDLAVGVIIGSAFTAIVNSLVNDILMPVLSLITGGSDFQNWYIILSTEGDGSKLNYGMFLSAILNFLLIAFVIFILVKFINKAMDMGKKKPEQAESAPATKECPYCKSNININAVKCPNCTSDLN